MKKPKKESKEEKTFDSEAEKRYKEVKIDAHGRQHIDMPAVLC